MTIKVDVLPSDKGHMLEEGDLLDFPALLFYLQ